MTSVAAPAVTSAPRLGRRIVRGVGALVLAGGALVLNLWFWGATVRDEPLLVVVREVPAGQPLAAEDLGTINALLERTLERRTVIACVRGYFRERAARQRQEEGSGHAG